MDQEFGGDDIVVLVGAGEFERFEVIGAVEGQTFLYDERYSIRFYDRPAGTATTLPSPTELRV